MLSSVASAQANEASECSQSLDNTLAIRACTSRIQALKSLQKGAITGLIARGYFGDKAIADAYNKRGAAYARKGQYQLAIGDYNDAMSLDTNNALYYFNRGSAFGSMRDYDRAIPDFDRALSLQQDFAEAYIGRSLAYLKAGGTNRALADPERALRLSPQNARALIVHADAVAALGRAEEAVVDYRKALSIDPALSEAAAAIRKLGFQP
jgi:tetratricopeptide (TPR) repeat protein